MPDYEKYVNRLNDIYFKKDTQENLAKKYGCTQSYISMINNRFKALKEPVKIINNRLVCSICNSEKNLVFHHRHRTKEMLSLICVKCNDSIGNLEGDEIETMWKNKDTIYIILKRENIDELAKELNEDIHKLIMCALEEGASGQYFVTSPSQRKTKKNGDSKDEYS